jgi:hypothetical protein
MRWCVLDTLDCFLWMKELVHKLKQQVIGSGAAAIREDGRLLWKGHHVADRTGEASHSRLTCLGCERWEPLRESRSASQHVHTPVHARVASRFTSFITGSAPVPVPITHRRHFQGISSSTHSGLCPKASRNFLDAFFLRLWTVPRSITTSCSWGDAIDAERTESEILEAHEHRRAHILRQITVRETVVTQ